MGNQRTHLAGLEVLAKLSSGGMGEVLLARKRGAHGFEKLLAVKTIRGELARRPDVRAMFLDEARLVARLDHSNIAQVHDFGEEDGALYLAMEFVPGIPLNQLLAQRARPMPPLVAARIAAEVARGLHAAHELTDVAGTPLGVVHRDVSPGNLILTYDGRIKILDFGIAFMAERESPDTQLGELKGKPSYMAPEQLRGEAVDRRSDVFSLGIVLHELLTGRKLFAKSNVVATALAVERGDAEPPSASGIELPAGIEAAVMRALARDPGERFPTAKSLADELERLVGEAGGGCLIETFVDAELDEARRAHRAWLTGVLSEAEATVAIPLKPQPLLEQLDEETRKIRRAPPRKDPPAHTFDPDPPTFLPPRRKAPVVLAVAIVAGVVGIALALRKQPAPAAKPIAPAPALETKKPAPKPTEASPVAPPKERPRPPSRAEVEPPVRRKPTAPERFGTLTIGANPYARVRIDGKDYGTTPLVQQKLPAGPHMLELIRPDTNQLWLRQPLHIEEGKLERLKFTAPD